MLIAVYTGTFNPPGLHHLGIVEALLHRFDRVHVIPCDCRESLHGLGVIPPVLRAALADLGFNGYDPLKVQVEHFDLEQESFTPAVDLDRRFAPEGEVWHVITPEQVADGRYGRSPIQTTWKDGLAAWHKLRFAVLSPSDLPPSHEDLPPNHLLIPTPPIWSSAAIRTQLRDGIDCASQLPERVNRFIKRYGLYQTSPPKTELRVRGLGKKIRLFSADSERYPNEKARAIAAEWQHLVVDKDPDCIVVLGGDGTMLRAIAQHWRERIPFLGLNAGHLGFLMNEWEELDHPDGRMGEEFILRRLPMLHVRMLTREGNWEESLCFNDAWIERQSAQTAWTSVAVNGEVRLEKLVSDGILACTAAGSTAYAMSMGASPLLADTPAWILVGSNVMRPTGWKSALLSMEDEVRIDVLESERRPMQGVLRGGVIENVVAMEARISRVASVELAFSPRHDMARKISDLQFRHMKAF